MEWTIALGLGGWALLLVGALAYGVIAQYVGDTRTGFEWVPVAIAAAIGALFASEFVIAWQAFEPVWDGLALVPALVGGLAFGVVADFVTRFATGGSYFHRHVGSTH